MTLLPIVFAILFRLLSVLASMLDLILIAIFRPPFIFTALIGSRMTSSMVNPKVGYGMKSIEPTHPLGCASVPFLNDTRFENWS